jgi:aconitate hydratase
VLTITEQLRRHGVVGKFVEFYGPGVGAVPVANRATLGNMSPEYGSTCAIFPIDEETLRYLRLTGRPREQVALVEAYAKEQGLCTTPHRELDYFEHLELDLSSVVPSLAGPKRPQDRVPLSGAKDGFRASLARFVLPGVPTQATPYGVLSAVDLALAASFPASRVHRPAPRTIGAASPSTSVTGPP